MCAAAGCSPDEEPTLSTVGTVAEITAPSPQQSTTNPPSDELDPVADRDAILVGYRETVASLVSAYQGKGSADGLPDASDPTLGEFLTPEVQSQVAADFVSLQSQGAAFTGMITFSQDPIVSAVDGQENTVSVTDCVIDALVPVKLATGAPILTDPRTGLAPSAEKPVFVYYVELARRNGDWIISLIEWNSTRGTCSRR
jgi:hypothetical protein